LVKQGLINGMKGSNIKMTPQEASGYLQSTMQSLQEKKMEKQYGANKEAGENFLRENAKKPGVITTPSGLQYEIIKKGNGPMPTDSSKVKVHYHGTLIDGTVFDSSVERNEPAEFYVNQVIKGWTEALKLMPVGSKFKIYVPYQLAYGSANQGKIKPFSMLIFEVELLSIEK
jgi:FKBP-type peptidyl-prolyl cis-trans isomerase FklB